jgi:hypothetical protein
MRTAIEIALIPVVWYFFGASWGVLTAFVFLAGLMFTHLNNRLSALEERMAVLREQIEKICRS